MFTVQKLPVLTLLDIMKLLKSRDLMLFMMDLEEREQSYKTLKQLRSPVEPPSEGDLEQFKDFLKQNEGVCDDIGLSSTAAKLSLIHTHLTHYPEEADYSSLCADCRNVRDVLMAESWDRKFVQIAPSYGTYVNNDSLLGDPVKVAFPSAQNDIQHAGNCLAVECGTAAVFHLMRAVEWGLRALCRDLGI